MIKRMVDFHYRLNFDLRTKSIKTSRKNILKAQYDFLSDVILRLCNNIIMYFDRYLSCFGIKIQIISANLYKLKTEY